MYTEQLIEKAIQLSLRKSLRGLAAQMGISSGILCEWKQGIKPIPDERIRQLAKIAKVDPGEWLLLIHMETAPGDLGREWRKLAIRLGVPMLALCVAVLPFFLAGSEAYQIAATPAMYIMSSSKGAASRWRYYWYLIKVVLGSMIAGPLKMRLAT